MGDTIDNLRRKTGIDKLDPNQRKKLFRDFVDHGGEVVEAKRKALSSSSAPPIDRKSASTGDQRDRAKQKAGKGEGNGVTASAAATAAQKAHAEHEKKQKKKNSLKMYVHGVMLRVFTLKGSTFRDKFLDEFRDAVKNHLMNLHLLVNSFLKGSSSIKKEIMALSTGENSLFYEMLYRMSILYEEQEFEAISKSFSNTTIPSGPYIELYREFFKKLYILGQYTDLCKFFIQKSVDIQLESEKVNRQLAGQIKPKLKAAVNSIFIDYLPRLHIILCKMACAYYPLYSQQLDDYLGFTEKDRIGYITRVEKKKRIDELKRMKEYLKKKQIDGHIEEREEIKAPRHVERGFRFIDEALSHFEESLQTRDDRNVYGTMLKVDKLYRTAILLETFEKEYSFILTTGKIAFNIDYQEQKKIDVKEDMNRAYLLLSEARHEVDDYLETMEEIYKTEENLRLTLHQKTGIVTTLQKKRSVLSKSSRTKVAEAMDSIHNILSTVINDYNGERRLLQNPDDKLDFTKDLDYGKKLHGRKIIEAIVEAFLFSSSFHFILTYGELSGSGLNVEDAE
jgi:hypothetical protein